jgi:hypothetical protein
MFDKKENQKPDILCRHDPMANVRSHEEMHLL